MRFSADRLPAGLSLDPATGNVTGSLHKGGDYKVRFHAKNRLGSEEKRFKIVVGEGICLTPAMGWNSFNHYSDGITEDLVLENAKAMVESGLIDFGWSYVNVDDGWQGTRGGPFNALQGNDKFRDFKLLCDQIHAMGLKAGIYSTPWETSYAGYPGSSSLNPEGTWAATPATTNNGVKYFPRRMGQYHFFASDARQWAAWGVDYLKFDWSPNKEPETKEMAEALRKSGRDIILSLSNSFNPTNAPAIPALANSWRTTGDIKANWKFMSDRGFSQAKWRAFASPGHWNDPDMLEIGTKEPHQPGLTPEEEYAHMTLWCLIDAPLLLGNDLTKMDAFTLNLLENGEVLGVSQDSLGDQAVEVARAGDAVVYAKRLADGAKAVGLFNTGTNRSITVTVRWSDLKIDGEQNVRDLWRQRELGRFKNQFELPVSRHGAELLKISKH